MKKKITFNQYDLDSINQAYKEVIKYKRWIKSKETKLLKELAKIGVTKAQIIFDKTIAIANGDTIHARLEPVTVSASNVVDHRIVISASGEDVAFIEFGAGVRYGRGYPATQVSGSSGRPDGVVGIGEYGKGKGNNPKGWWYDGKDGEAHHSYGTPPAMAMYNAEKDIVEQVTSILREVFKE